VRQFVRQSQSWLAERHSRVQTVASTVVGGRAVVELLAHLAWDGRELAWPVAVVAESPDDRSVVFRSYFSQRRSTDSATCDLPSSSPGPPIPVMSSAAIKPRWPLVTPRRSCAPSSRTGITVSPSARPSPAAAPGRCGR
jgi:hypothetical protein